MPIIVGKMAADLVQVEIAWTPEENEAWLSEKISSTANGSVFGEHLVEFNSVVKKSEGKTKMMNFN